MSQGAQIVQFLINAVSLGSLYALMALGLVIVYGILRLVNFAYGELVMVGGYALFLLSTQTALPWLMIAVLTVVAAMLTSYLTERIAFRPVRDRSITAMLVTSFAVSVLLQNAALLIVSPRPRAVPLPEIFTQTVTWGGVIIPMRNLLAIGVSIVVLIALSLLLKHTILGIALRAASDNFVMTRMLGIPANMVIASAFAISGFLAGVVSLFWIGRIASVTPTIGETPLVIAFIATVIGGLRSMTGAVVGGYLFGFITVTISLVLPQSLLNFRDAFIFALVILILLFRPEGLISSRYSVERVG